VQSSASRRTQYFHWLFGAIQVSTCSSSMDTGGGHMHDLDRSSADCSYASLLLVALQMLPADCEWVFLCALFAVHGGSSYKQTRHLTA
jgi:hypothetical protein